MGKFRQKGHGKTADTTTTNKNSNERKKQTNKEQKKEQNQTVRGWTHIARINKTDISN